ncbi:MAG TPA: YdcF family protein [Steroidobacteraceae bacterium]|nr:YdcF family protein [Steroidobacteraceae bacterium]
MHSVFGLKLLIKPLILPPAGLVLLGFLGVILLRRRPRLARAVLIFALASLWLLSLPVVCDALTGLAEAYPPLDWQRAADARAIVILGGGGQRSHAPEYGGPAADPVLLERLSYGAFVAHKTGLPILVTGLKIEASAMRATLQRNFGIEPRWIDAQSHDTFDNATYSMRLLQAAGIRRIVLVTSATHMRRAAHEFTDAGAEVVPAPAGMLARRDPGFTQYLPNADAMLRSQIAINELLGEPVRAFLAATGLRRHAGRPEQPHGAFDNSSSHIPPTLGRRGEPESTVPAYRYRWLRASP